MRPTLCQLWSNHLSAPNPSILGHLANHILLCQPLPCRLCQGEAREGDCRAGEKRTCSFPSASRARERPPSGTSSCGQGPFRPRAAGCRSSSARAQNQPHRVPRQTPPPTERLPCSGDSFWPLQIFLMFSLCSFCFPALGMVASRSCYLILQIPISPSQQFFVISSLFMLQVSASWLDSHCSNSHLYFTETLIVIV